MTQQTKTLIAFATRWGAQFGGINCFNFDLLCAFGAAFYQQVKTICVVLYASKLEIESASSEHVHLISLDRPDQEKFPEDLEAHAWVELHRVGIQFDADHTAWLGHDRITGGVALAAAKKRGGRAALIHHMSYSRYEAFAENSALAKIKETEQKQLFKQADVLLAVGPLLCDALEDMVEHRSVDMLVPGLPDITAKGAPKRFTGFLSGRLDDDAKKIKQAHLGVAAFAHAIRQADENEGLPDVLRGENEPGLTLRGVDFEKSSGGYDKNAENALMQFATDCAGRVFPLHALPFTTNREELFDELRNASVAMMPSWHEGFGLVAWEAIAAGVPLVISKKSGAYRLLKEFKNGLYTSWITSIDVAGDIRKPFFQEDDRNRLARELINIAKDPNVARDKAARLREALSREYSWINCAKQLGDALDWRPRELGQVPAYIAVHLPISAPHSKKLLVLPERSWRPNAGLSSSQLLRVEEAIIPFDSKREPFLDVQLDWANSTDYPLAVRLLTGAGGVGKTRLALELCQRLQAQGWQAGFLRDDCEESQVVELSRQVVEAHKACCIVIDYAETRQATLLALLKLLLTVQPQEPIRVFLLARDGGEWWDLLPAKEAACEPLLNGLACSGPFPLPQLHDRETDRQEAYRLALRIFAGHLQMVPPENVPSFNEAHFAHPLYIQMAALIALHGERPKSAEALPKALVHHERRYWRKALLALGGKADESEHQAAQLLALVTMANGIANTREIEAIWLAVGGEKALLKPLFRALMPLYPDRHGMQGLRPDLLGEALVAQVLLSSTGQALLSAVLEHGTHRLRQSSITVVARLLRNRADVAPMLEIALSDHFLRCADEFVTASIETNSQLSLILENAFARLPKNIRWQAAKKLKHHFEYENWPLIGLASLIGKSLVDQIEHRLNAKERNHRLEDIKSEYAKALLDYSIDLQRQGSIGAALEHAEKSLNIYQELAGHGKTHGDKFDIDIANVNKRIAEYLHLKGDMPAAVEALERSLVFYRSRSLADQLAEPDFALCLSGYSQCLINTGSPHKAREASAQALEIFKRWVDFDPEYFRPYLANVLANHALCLRSNNEHADALLASSDALNIWNSLSKEKPNRYEPFVARWAANHAIHLCEQGMYSDAADIFDAAIAIFKKLALTKPERFEPYLAKVYYDKAVILELVGKLEGAIFSINEALPIFRRLSSDEILARILSLYAGILCAQGNYDGALNMALESIELSTKLTQLDPGASLYKLTIDRLDLALWKLLHTNEHEQMDIIGMQPPKLEPDEQIQFELRKYLLKLLSWETSSVDRIAIQNVIDIGANLPLFARDSAAKHYILLLAIAEYQGIPYTAETHWRDQLLLLRNRVGGKLPIWMSDAAQRVGVAL